MGACFSKSPDGGPAPHLNPVTKPAVVSAVHPVPLQPRDQVDHGLHEEYVGNGDLPGTHGDVVGPDQGFGDAQNAEQLVHVPVGDHEDGALNVATESHTPQVSSAVGESAISAPAPALHPTTEMDEEDNVLRPLAAVETPAVHESPLNSTVVPSILHDMESEGATVPSPRALGDAENLTGQKHSVEPSPVDYDGFPTVGATSTNVVRGTDTAGVISPASPETKLSTPRPRANSVALKAGMFEELGKEEVMSRVEVVVSPRASRVAAASQRIDAAPPPDRLPAPDAPIASVESASGHPRVNYSSKNAALGVIPPAEDRVVPQKIMPANPSAVTEEPLMAPSQSPFISSLRSGSDVGDRSAILCSPKAPVFSISAPAKSVLRSKRDMALSVSSGSPHQKKDMDSPLTSTVLGVVKKDQPSLIELPVTPAHEVQSPILVGAVSDMKDPLPLVADTMNGTNSDTLSVEALPGATSSPVRPLEDPSLLPSVSASSAVDALSQNESNLVSRPEQLSSE